jgi:hypothetical protein
MEVGMLVEVLGVLSGAVVVSSALVILFRHERWKIVRSAYGAADRSVAGRNALIWPSR